MRVDADFVRSNRTRSKNYIIKIAVILFVALLVLVSVFANTYTANAESLTENIDEQLENINFNEIEQFIDNLGNDELNKTSFFDKIKAVLNGNLSLSYESVFDAFLSQIIGDVSSLAPAFLSVIAIAVLSSVVSNLRSSFLSSGVKEMVFFVCFLAIDLIVVTKVFESMQSATATVSKIAEFSTVVSPIMLTLMTACGATTSIGIFKPAVLFLSNGIVSIINVVVIPLVSLTVIFAILSNMSENVKLNKFADFFSGAIKWILGISCTVFTVFLSVQGITSASVDGISLRATRYAIQNSVPIIGGFLGSGAELIIAGAVLIKSAVGVGATVVLFYLVLSPFVNLLLVQLLLKLCSAVTEPIADKRISNLTASLSKSISYLIACVLLVGFMLLMVFVLLILTAGNLV